MVMHMDVDIVGTLVDPTFLPLPLPLIYTFPLLGPNQYNVTLSREYFELNCILHHSRALGSVGRGGASGEALSTAEYHVQVSWWPWTTSSSDHRQQHTNTTERTYCGGVDEQVSLYHSIALSLFRSIARSTAPESEVQQSVPRHRQGNLGPRSRDSIDGGGTVVGRVPLILSNWAHATNLDSAGQVSG
jgi:hypothetical protein